MIKAIPWPRWDPERRYCSGTSVTFKVVTVDNTAPVVKGATLTPKTASTSDVLTCAPDGAADADSDKLAYTYTWYVKTAAGTASVVGPVKGNTYTGSLRKGDSLYCTVIADDGTDQSSESAASNTVTINNTVPVVKAATLSPAKATVADTLTCAPSGAADADGDKLTFTYTFYIRTAAGSTSTAGPSSTATFALGKYSKGDSVYVQRLRTMERRTVRNPQRRT